MFSVGREVCFDCHLCLGLHGVAGGFHPAALLLPLRPALSPEVLSEPGECVPSPESPPKADGAAAVLLENTPCEAMPHLQLLPQW